MHTWRPEDYNCQRMNLGVIPQALSKLCFGTDSPTRLGWLCSSSRDPRPHHFSTKNTNAYSHDWIFLIWILGVVLMLARQTLDGVSHHHSSMSSLINMKIMFYHTGLYPNVKGETETVEIYLFTYCIYFWNRVSLYSTSWTKILYVDQAALKQTEIYLPLPSECWG